MPSDAAMLVVDDDPVIRLLVQGVAERAQMEFVQSDSGVDALALSSARHFDVIVLDVRMTGMDGFEVCARMRERVETQHVPIVMMTALGDVEAIEAAYRAGATDFITKPLNPLLLAHRLRYIVRAAKDFKRLRDGEKRLSRVQRLTRLVQWEYDLNSGEFSWAPEVVNVLGIAPVVSTLEALTDYVHPEDRTRVASAMTSGRSHTLEYRLLALPGPGRNLRHEAELVAEESTLRLIGAVQDITEMRLAERQISRLAYFDNLTQLPNRLYLTEYVQQIAAAGWRREQGLAVLSIGLDAFKRVNDVFGYAEGDAVLVQVARVLATSVHQPTALPSLPIGEESSTQAGKRPEAALVARLSGDVFAIAVGALDGPGQAAELADRILRRLERAITVGGAEVLLSASIGIATFPAPAARVEELLEQSDAAMYQAKAGGRSGYRFYDSTVQARVKRRAQLERSLRRAVAQLDWAQAPLGRGSVRGATAEVAESDSRLDLHFQPKVDSETDETVGVEALLRWRLHGEMIRPDEFIAIAEETGLIVPLGEWVLWKACQAASALGDVRVAVNISPRQLVATDLLATIERMLAESRLPATQLELEFTEGVVMQDSSASRELLERLRRRGIRLALDDFGTGYSSLSYLATFPLDVVKIDRSFVRNLSRPRGDALVNAIVAMARSLDLQIVVEGVETREEYEFFLAQGRLEIQGYYLSKPQPFADVARWIEARRFALGGQGPSSERVAGTAR